MYINNAFIASCRDTTFKAFYYVCETKGKRKLTLGWATRRGTISGFGLSHFPWKIPVLAGFGLLFSTFYGLGFRISKVHFLQLFEALF